MVCRDSKTVYMVCRDSKRQFTWYAEILKDSLHGMLRLKKTVYMVCNQETSLLQA